MVRTSAFQAENMSSILIGFKSHSLMVKCFAHNERLLVRFQLGLLWRQLNWQSRRLMTFWYRFESYPPDWYIAQRQSSGLLNQRFWVRFPMQSLPITQWQSVRLISVKSIVRIYLGGIGYSQIGKALDFGSKSIGSSPIILILCLRLF